MGLTARGVAVAVTLCAAFAAPTPEAASTERPNIVLIVTDDQDLATIEHMPNVRALLQDEGMTFSNALVNFPLCCPSRASILRGQNARTLNIWNNYPPGGGYVDFYHQGHESETIGVWMQRAGYHTGFFGKYLNGYPNQAGLPLRHVPPGWDHWFGLYAKVQEAYDYSVNENGHLSDRGDYITDVLSRKATEYIGSRGTDPFLLTIWPTSPHVPMNPAPRHAALHPGLQVPRTPNFNEADVSDKTQLRTAAKLTDKAIAALDAEHRLRVLELLAVDELVAAVVDKLAETSQLDNTFIIFTSDNGYLLGQHRSKQKVSPYEESIRVPLIIRGPGIEPGSVSEALVGNIDLAPTFAELGDATIPIDPDGRSFVDLLADPPASASWRHAFYVSTRLFEGVRTPETMYIEFADGQRELYDIAADPYQLQNIYPSAPASVRSEHAEMLEVFRSGGEPVPPKRGLEADAGDDRVLTLPDHVVALHGEASHDGVALPPTGVVVEWRQRGGPAGVVFSTPTTLATEVDFPGAGVYPIELTIDNGTEVAADTVLVTVREPRVRALIVAGDDPLPSGDEPIRSRIEAAGMEVAVVDDDRLPAADLDDVDLVFITSSVVPSKVGSAFHDAAIPLITSEGYLFDDLGLARSGSGETSTAFTKVSITNPSHPLAAGMSGTPAVFTSASTFSTGQPATTAAVVGRASATQAVLFSYDTGDLLADGSTAPAPRIALFPSYQGAQRLTPSGIALIDAAITAASGGPGLPTNRAPTVDAGADVEISLPQTTVSLSGLVRDDGLPLPPGAVTVGWRQVLGPEGVTLVSPASASTAATFPGAGVYRLELSANDGATTAADTVTVTVVGDDGGTGIRRAILLAGDIPLPAGDAPIQSRLESAGLDVTVVDDDADLHHLDLDDIDLLFITSSVSPSKVGAVFKDAPVPVITSEGYLFDDLALAHSGSGETATAFTKLTITDATHPLAAGQSGAPIVFTTPLAFSAGQPGATAEVVARASATQAVVFAYDAGTELVDGSTAPAPRIATFLSYHGARRLTSAGTRLLDAAIAVATAP